MKTKNFAVDFDGTLCDNAWPNIGKPHTEMINYIKRLRKKGHKIILWTCREGPDLEKAVEWCSKRGLVFDAVNDNLEETKQWFGGNSRKIVAHYYIDDRALPAIPL